MLEVIVYALITGIIHSIVFFIILFAFYKRDEFKILIILIRLNIREKMADIKKNMSKPKIKNNEENILTIEDDQLTNTEYLRKTKPLVVLTTKETILLLIIFTWGAIMLIGVVYILKMFGVFV